MDIIRGASTVGTDGSKAEDAEGAVMAGMEGDKLRLVSVDKMGILVQPRVEDLLSRIFVQLKVMNMHLSLLTEAEILDSEAEADL